MAWELIQQQISQIAEEPSAYSTQEILSVFQDIAQHNDGVMNEEWARKYLGPIQEELRSRGENSSTEILLRNNAHIGESGDIYIKAVLQWAATPISTKYLHSGGSANLGCEYVWYDLYIYDAYTSALLCTKTWIYGNSAWQFVNNGAGYAIIK